ncbi:MAG: DUF881 domain-containing protein [Peptococcaceae bacterium]|jgi:uncharacterized protein YlxW (UPF0749 family)|nr:DUF881 domain-containing protein [Peptococcaceae bacterium]
MKKFGAALTILLACFLIGCLFSLRQGLAAAAENQGGGLGERMDNLVSTISDLEQEIAAYEGLIEEYRAELEAIEDEHQTTAIQLLREELKMAQLRAGLTAVSGQGIEISLDDNFEGKRLNPEGDPNNYIIHYDDLLSIIADLRVAGAEAIAVNEQRLIATSELRCVGNVILVNTTRIAPPFIIQAIGSPAILRDTVAHGRFEFLQLNHFPAILYEAEELVLPAYKGDLQFNHAKSV